MTSNNNNNWIADTVGDFIHSPIWAAPIQTFIEANCAAFDYDDDDITDEDNAASLSISVEEQMSIHEKYRRLANALIDCLGNDLSLDKDELNRVCQLPTAVDESATIDESYEQLYAAKDFQLFQEMMRRKNLILQLQALVSLQLQWGLLQHSDTGDDLILSLLLQATASPTRRDSINRSSEPIQQPVEKQSIPVIQGQHHQNNHDDDDDDDDVVIVPQKQPPPPVSSHRTKERKEPRKPPKEEYHLPGLRRRGGDDLDAEWYRKLQQDNPQKDDDDDDDDTIEDVQPKQTSIPQTLGGIRNEVLRKKLHELTDLAASSVDDETAAAITSRKNFFKKQRELIIEKQRAERARDLEKQTQQQEQQETRNARPQSAAHVARKAMATVSKTNENKQGEQQTQIPDAELLRRRAMADRLKREVVDKR